MYSHLTHTHRVHVLYCCSIYRTVSHLGSGHFGNVDKGLWRSSKNKAVEVALKSLTKSASDEDEVKFLQEAVIMAQFDHPNVISLYGVVSTGMPVSFAQMSCIVKTKYQMLEFEYPLHLTHSTDHACGGVGSQGRSQRVSHFFET